MFKKTNKERSKLSNPSSSPQVNKIESQTNENSFKNSIISGFGFGIGSSIGNKITDSIFSKNNNCNELKLKLDNCVTESKVDCKKLYDNFFNNCT